MARKMAPKRVRFVEEYLKDLNGTQAAIRAGYSAKTAKQIGCELLTFPDVAEAIQVARNQESADNRVTVERVRAAFADIAYAEGAEETRDRISALTQLGRHLGMFVDKTEHSGEVKTGGVLVVPMPVDKQAWDEMAAAQQQALAQLAQTATACE